MQLQQQQQQDNNVTGLFGIPKFRRVVSFVGRDEGFDLFSIDDTAGAGYDNDLPSPRLMENVQYAFSSDFGTSDFGTYTKGPLNFDFANINGDTILGAIPAQPIEAMPTQSASAIPAAGSNNEDQEEGEDDDEQRISCGSYTRAERRKIIANYRRKKSQRVWHKRVMYKCRQNFAQNRRRVHGRFVKLDGASNAAKAVKSPAVKAVASTPESPPILDSDVHTDHMDESSCTDIELDNSPNNDFIFDF